MSALTGKTLVVTRPAPEAAAWADRLRALGARVVVLPCVEIEPVRDPARGRALAVALREAAWAVFTSPRAVTATAALLPGGLPQAVAVACVGPATAAAARRAWGRVDLVGSQGGRSLARALRERLPAPSPTVVVPGADRARRDLEVVLTPAGVTVRRFTVYHTRPARPASPPLDLGRLGVDGVLLASPSAVAGLCNRARIPRGVPCVALGPTTAAAARAAGLHPVREARRPTLEAMLEVLS